MQHKAVYLLFCKFTLHVSGVNHTHHLDVHKTVTAASGTGHIFCAATSLQRGQTWPRWREVATQKIWPVPEAVVTVLCIPDDGCGWHPNHVEWACRIINRLLCVASRWTIIDIDCIRIHLKTSDGPVNCKKMKVLLNWILKLEQVRTDSRRRRRKQWRCCWWRWWCLCFTVQITLSNYSFGDEGHCRLEAPVLQWGVPCLHTCGSCSNDDRWVALVGC